MKTTIDLGKELASYANNITNIYTTHDYVGRLLSAYKRHVKSFYEQDIDNKFTIIYKFKMLLKDTDLRPYPCNNPLKDIDSAKEAVDHIMGNRKAYRYVINILMKDCKGTNDAGSLIYDLLSVLKSSSGEFKTTALKYDRYMGNEFSVANILNTIYAYGYLTGLVDFYNMEEGKDS